MIRRVLLAIVAALPLWAAGQGYKVLTSEQGLSSSLITCVRQDHNGMVWIATEDGLNRWDGVKMTTYRHDEQDTTSLGNNYVSYVFETAEGRLLIGTHNGLYLYDPATDGFRRATASADPYMDNHINHIMQRANGDVMLAGNRMCRVEWTDDGGFRCTDPGLPLPDNMLACMLEDREGNLWTSRTAIGVFRMDTKGQVKHYPLGPDMPNVEGLREDNEGNIYGLSASRGVMLYDHKADRFRPATPHQDLQSMTATDLLCAGPNEVYICSDGQGLKILNNKTWSMTDFVAEDCRLVNGNAKMHSVCKDRSGNLWLGVYQKGVVMLPPQRRRFAYWGPKSVSHDIIGQACVTALCRLPDGTTLVGTDNDGLYVVAPDGRGVKHYSHNGADPASVPGTIMAIARDGSGQVWLGSWGQGMARLDVATGRCQYVKDWVNRNGAPVLNVTGFAQDDQQRLWVCSMGGGLHYVDMRTGQLHAFDELNKVYQGDWLNSVTYSRRNQCLYLGAYDGMWVVRLNRSDYFVEDVGIRAITSPVHEQNDSIVWVGTATGLVRLNLGTHEQRTYTTADGLPNDNILAIEVGRDECLWLSTSGGLCKFVPGTAKCANFYASDGVQSNEFSRDASWRDPDGTLWFGGTEGVTSFNSSEINSTSRKWTLRVTDFYVAGVAVRKGTKSGGSDIIDRAVFETDEFRLAHTDNSFTIEFSTAELDNTERITYSYRMAGGPWIDVPRGTHRISFSNLAPGRYRFTLRARDGELWSEPRTVTIHIAQPWWLSWWMWLVYAAIALAAAGMVTLHIRQRIRVRRERRRMAQIEEINEAKLQFFINVSHEIRTPMTLITSPLQQLMGMGDDDKHQRIYRTIQRNADRILQLVNQLMDIRKIEKGKMRLTFAKTDPIEVIDDLRSTFADALMKKGVSLSFAHPPVDEIDLWVDPPSLDKVMMNLISNAFKFTPQGGSIHIELTLGKHSMQVVVTDSGQGVPPDEVEHIFERFYQTRNVANYHGTGVGLHLTRQLVHLHRGTIVARQRADGQQGAEFVLTLPLGNSHLRPEDMAQTEAPTPRPTYSGPTVAEESDDNARRAQRAPRVLVVEDDAEIRNYICQELGESYRVQECQNGREALDVVFRKAPDLIISDIMMPEVDGLALTRKIRQNINLNHIPIILLTAKVREEENIEGLDTGADAYVTKPFSIEVLRHTVANLIKSRDQLRNIYTGAQHVGNQLAEQIEAKSPDDRLMERIMKVVNANMSNPNLTVEGIAQEIGMSRAHLHRKLKELTNQTTRDFLRNVRMQQAAKLLASKRHAISEVAHLTGFGNLSTFSTTFKETFGVTPTDYRDNPKSGD